MEIVDLIALVLPGIPNFAGLVIAVFMFYRQNNRLLDILEQQLDE